MSGKAAYLPGGSYAGMCPLSSFSPTLHLPIPSNGSSSFPALLRKHPSAYPAHTAFAAHDASRALALTSVKPDDVRPEWSDLPAEKIAVLDDWVTFFGKRYNVVGVVQGATNM